MIPPRFKYPSVTEILDPWHDFSRVKPAVLKAAQTRGTIVHGICAGYAKFGFVVGKIPVKYQGYFDSFRRWFDAEAGEVLAVEERIFNDALRVCGQLDLLMYLDHSPKNLPLVIDIKTPTIVYHTWSAQVSAYKVLAEHAKKIVTGVPCSLQVKEDGSMAKLRPVDNFETALRYWLKALECYHYFSGK